MGVLAQRWEAHGHIRKIWIRLVVHPSSSHRASATGGKRATPRHSVGSTRNTTCRKLEDDWGRMFALRP
eukprot:6651997-Alexandrium_andersonii.AAC.1